MSTERVVTYILSRTFFWNAQSFTILSFTPPPKPKACCRHVMLCYIDNVIEINSNDVLGKVNSPASLKSPANLLMWLYL